ncbi:hypothetical protein CC80DRAFT_278563 [Byssothecium circinans]|uniref:Uncharacterized protein n=1 Tax=Byssothecium circinans TaxID=147558 RepID=A0A6A5TAC0_9PLEO|nr:hypothetical protein CC80DRAFT_278563 [Byssothecium circinans]
MDEDMDTKCMSMYPGWGPGLAHRDDPGPIKCPECIEMHVTHKTDGESMTLEAFRTHPDDYLSFHPWLDAIAWTIQCALTQEVRSNNYVNAEPIDGEFVNLDYRCDWAYADKSIVAVIILAYEDDLYRGFEDFLFLDAFCLLTEQIEAGIFRRIGIWQRRARCPTSTLVGGMESMLPYMMKGVAIKSDEEWVKRSIRLV